MRSSDLDVLRASLRFELVPAAAMGMKSYLRGQAAAVENAELKVVGHPDDMSVRAAGSNAERSVPLVLGAETAMSRAARNGHVSAQQSPVLLSRR